MTTNLLFKFLEAFEKRLREEVNNSDCFNDDINYGDWEGQDENAEEEMINKVVENMFK